ncbi:hypothetical protein BT96DRAFT_1002887 [Gymnopus androsaceus JB14]|uniref:Uncharacterized protein n=1 Tax=Gymnopus androsaceus JB14 TaxID=1447944 RepID=A0A6A4GWD8_9AGAR|nr:hypothetical protein BT96DRAFT_1002887 [Gymnopus androsaceus JB14]
MYIPSPSQTISLFYISSLIPTIVHTRKWLSLNRTSNFTLRLDLEFDGINDLLHSESGPLDSARVAETISLIGNSTVEGVPVLKQVQSLVAPVRKLPNEVLMSIFNLVSQENLLREDRESSFSSDLWPDGEHGLTIVPALVLSGVCSRWRQISLSYSALWSRMTLVLLQVYITDDTKASLLTMVKLYINRSRTSLLRLRIGMAEDYPDELAPHPALFLLGRTTKRWHYLTFIGRSSPSPTRRRMSELNSELLVA